MEKYFKNAGKKRPSNILHYLTKVTGRVVCILYVRYVLNPKIEIPLWTFLPRKIPYLFANAIEYFVEHRLHGGRNANCITVKKLLVYAVAFINLDKFLNLYTGEVKCVHCKKRL